MGHFYLPDGTPFYQVPYAGKREGMRDANITDARKVGAYPSVTTILDTIAKPGLVNWKIEQAILAALTNPDITPDMGIREIMQILKRDAAEQAKVAAEQGTAIHDAIEAYYRDGTVIKEHASTVFATVETINEHCGEQEWEAEKWFASDLGYGGKIDLISPEWVLDIKTKEGEAENHKMYDEQFMQLVAYDQGEYAYSRTKKSISIPTRRLANVIVSRDIPGSVQFWEWGNKQTVPWMKFLSLLDFWHYDKGYFPHRDTSD